MASPTPTPDKEFDRIAFRNACGGFATGVTVITARDGDIDHGMTANAFMSISLDPPLIAVSIADTARMLDHINNSGRFAVSILAEGHETLALHFAGQPAESVTDPLLDFDGLPVLRESCVAFATHVEHKMRAGDHTIFIGRVSAMYNEAERQPLVFHQGQFGKLHDEDAARRVEMEKALWSGSHW